MPPAIRLFMSDGSGRADRNLMLMIKRTIVDSFITLHPTRRIYTQGHLLGA